MLDVTGSKRLNTRVQDFFKKHWHAIAFYFWGPERAHFGSLEALFTIDLNIAFFKLMVCITSPFTTLSFVQIRSADFGLQSYFQKFTK